MLNKTRSVLRSTIGQILVDFGVVLDRKGAKFSYEKDVHQPFSRHRTIAPLECSKPTLSKGVRLAYTASVEGEVQIDQNSIIGNMSTLRGDDSPIRIGEGTIIGEQVSMHTREFHQLIPGSIDIGLNVYIGDKVTLKSCVIDDGAYIGEGSFIAEGAIIERGAILLPNTTVQPGAVLTSGKVWGGNPCREIEDITEKHIDRVSSKVKNALAFAESVEHDKVFMIIGNGNDNLDK